MTGLDLINYIVLELDQRGIRAYDSEIICFLRDMSERELKNANKYLLVRGGKTNER